MILSLCTIHSTFVIFCRIHCSVFSCGLRNVKAMLSIQHQDTSLILSCLFPKLFFFPILAVTWCFFQNRTVHNLHVLYYSLLLRGELFQVASQTDLWGIFVLHSSIAGQNCSSVVAKSKFSPSFIPYKCDLVLTQRPPDVSVSDLFEARATFDSEKGQKRIIKVNKLDYCYNYKCLYQTFRWYVQSFTQLWPVFIIGCSYSVENLKQLHQVKRWSCQWKKTYQRMRRSSPYLSRPASVWDCACDVPTTVIIFSISRSSLPACGYTRVQPKADSSCPSIPHTGSAGGELQTARAGLPPGVLRPQSWAPCVHVLAGCVSPCVSGAEHHWRPRGKWSVWQSQSIKSRSGCCTILVDH